MIDVMRGLKKIKTVICCLLFVSSAINLSAENSLFSSEASFIRVLELQGELNRSFLNYRSVDDENWDSETLENNFSGISTDYYMSKGDVNAQIFPVETFLSYNTAYPYGGNDGALWQGVGLNSSVSLGGNISAKGFSVTLKPSFVYSQNRDFDILNSAYADSDGYGYFWGGMDSYQRPGGSFVANFSWGDSEVRYNRNSFTLGFGTQSVWLGPGVNNSLILSNNAAPFPKLDIGFHKVHFRNWGEFELRAFWGKLSESDWFDDDSDNDHNLISAISASWSPEFFPELTLGLHRTMLSKWEDVSSSSIGGIILPDFQSTGDDESDQRFSITGELLFTKVGFRVWSEIAYNDFYRNWDSFIRYPFHTLAYTFGSEKVWKLANPDYLLMIQGEVSSTESSRDTAIYWPQTFYSHGIITQGYTNQGQILGASYGTGGTYQNFTVTFVHPQGDASLYVERQNVDNDYIYFLNSGSGITVQSNEKDRWRLKAIFTAGADTTWILNKGMLFSAGLAFNMVHNPLYNDDDNKYSDVLNSFYFYTGLKIGL